MKPNLSKKLMWRGRAKQRKLKLPIIYFFLVTLGSSPISISAQTDFYVDPSTGSDHNSGNSISTPLKTIGRARDMVRTVNRNMTGNISVYLRGGTYFLDTTLVLFSQDGGSNGFDIIYRPYNCEKPILSGGIKISNWTLHDGGKNIYKAFVDPSTNSRQLYINGARGTRARSTDATGWAEEAEGYTCPDEVQHWKNISNVEIVSYMVWKCHRGPIASVSGTHAKMAQPYWQNLHVQFDAPPAWVENAYELLDAEGEWYLDRSANTIYYKPLPGEDMATTEVILPKLETLLYAKDVRNVEFRGIGFEHATWLAPNTPKGHSVHQADETLTSLNWMGFEQMPGNILLDHCSNIKFNSCDFRRLGSTALQLWKGCRNNIIYNNSFTEISGSGISVGPLSDSFPSPEDVLKDNVLTNNFISGVANEYGSCVGIIVGYTDHTVVSHNEIRNLPYTGISVGWGWSNTKTVAKNNEISYNLLDSVVSVLFDGGSIYTLSAQAGTQVHHNYIRNQVNDHAALYIDQGSSNIRYHHNVLDNVYRWVDLTPETCANDTVNFNYHNTDAHLFLGVDNILANNTFVSANYWPAEAIEIMKNAGRRPTDSCSGDITWTPINAINAINLYPNPTPDKFRLSLSKPFQENYTVSIYDVHGRLLHQVQKGQSEVMIDLYLGRFPAGLYIIKINSGKYLFVGKVIKK